MTSRFAQTIRVWACSALMAVVAAPQAKDDQPAPEEIERASRSLQDMIERTGALQERARNLLKLANEAKATSEVEGVTREIAALSAQLDTLATAFAVEVKALRVATNPTRARIMAALKLPALKEVRVNLEQIEAGLEKESPGGEQDGTWLLGLARYQLADTMRQQAVQDARGSSDDRDAEKLLERAIDTYGKVLFAEDAPVPEVGTSLHAAALRRIVQVRASLYEMFRDGFKRRPTVQSYRKSRDEHQKAAQAEFDRLQRVFPDAKLSDGRMAVEAARKDVEKLTR